MDMTYKGNENIGHGGQELWVLVFIIWVLMWTRMFF